MIQHDLICFVVCKLCRPHGIIEGWIIGAKPPVLLRGAHI